jgi:non-heme chloroperoxidase
MIQRVEHIRPHLQLRALGRRTPDSVDSAFCVRGQLALELPCLPGKRHAVRQDSRIILTGGPYLNRISPSSVIVLTALLITSGGPGVAADWKDPSKHIIRFVEVEPGVKLEVLDWGGSGQPVLLLAGHGDTGHVFDDFAPRLTSGFRVFAITRRGFGASSQPVQGYGLATMVQDIARVADTLKLGRVNLAGHSIAGDEMTRFALTYPDRVGKLVYLEAAYDRVEAQRVEASFPKMPPPPPEARESGSPEAVRALLARTEILMPESEIRATRIFGPDGLYLRPVTPESIVLAVARMVEHPDYRSIRAQILAIYAVYQTPADLSARYKTADSGTRQGLDQVFALWQSFAKGQRELLRKSVPRARVDEIQGASHYVFISNRDRVLKDILAFLAAH